MRGGEAPAAINMIADLGLRIADREKLLAESWRLVGIDVRDLGFIVEPGETPKRVYVTELLSWKVPSIGRPYCCYANTVIFYVYPYLMRRDNQGYQEWDRIESLLQWDTDFLLDGRIYRCGGGRVIYRRKGWWMRHWAKLKEPPQSAIDTPRSAIE